MATEARRGGWPSTPVATTTIPVPHSYLFRSPSLPQQQRQWRSLHSSGCGSMRVTRMASFVFCLPVSSGFSGNSEKDSDTGFLQLRRQRMQFGGFAVTGATTRQFGSGDDLSFCRQRSSLSLSLSLSLFLSLSLRGWLAR
ncbi:hypothetical protein AAHE18_15G241900 [Arachis hypogaea]